MSGQGVEADGFAITRSAHGKDLAIAVDEGRGGLAIDDPEGGGVGDLG
mgnify:CR=1 FL=1